MIAVTSTRKTYKPGAIISPTQAACELSINKVMWLSLGILLASFPHWQRLPVWIPILHVALLTARIYIPYQLPAFWSHQKTTINIIRLLIMFGSVFSIYGSYGSLAGRDVGVALLVVLAGLKIFESKSKRDYYISTYLGYFLIITNFFYTQTIPTAAYMMFVIIIMTAGLIEFNDTEQQLTLLERIKLSTTLLIQSIPILLVLFILFPRVNGPLWGIPKDAFTGITGIDDQMSPGTISKLVQSREVAFRVTFEDKIPEQSKLYWRGPVLWQTDGRKWTTGKTDSDSIPAPIEYTGEAIHYDVTIEPTNKKWLFGLEMVSKLPDKTYLTNDYQLKTLEPIRARKAFTLISNDSYRLGTETITELERGLRLPGANHPKTRELASTMRDEFKDPSLIVQAALEWLRKEKFVYTLQPPLITGDMVDEFLFNSRQGFCEHYAAAFTVLMRAAGVPARVVTGYLGGEVNPVGNYLIVRQHYAHAWTEVWLDNQGWVRIDPTSVVSPGRVSEGIENVIPDALIDIPLGLDNNITAVRLWHRLRNTVDMVNYQWAQWILGYGPERQKRFLQQFGFKSINWKELTFALFVFLGIIITVIAAYVLKNKPKTADPAKTYYDIFCRKMALAGLPRRAYEGPIDFAQRISTVRQDLKSEIKNITDLYIVIRYCSKNNKLLQLKTAIKSFAPGKTISMPR
jgi:protein-glutamine gamma-glutamyltransferase